MTYLKCCHLRVEDNGTRNAYIFKKQWITNLKNFLKNRKLIPICIVPSSLNKLKSRIYEIIALHIVQTDEFGKIKSNRIIQAKSSSGTPPNVLQYLSWNIFLFWKDSYDTQLDWYLSQFSCIKNKLPIHN